MTSFGLLRINMVMTEDFPSEIDDMDVENVEYSEENFVNDNETNTSNEN